MSVKLTIQEHVSLQDYNTLAVPALARWFARIDNEPQLLEALAFRKQQQCELLLLGGGSNVVLADDFPGLCVQMNIQGTHIESETDEHIFLSVAAGESWHKTVMYCVDNDFYGLENLALIPGSVGAAPVQNIGAYGVEIEQSLSYIEGITIDTEERFRLQHSECQFSYRDSIFKQKLKDKVIITRVVLRLSKTPSWSLEYPALKAALDCDSSRAITARSIANAVIVIRQSKLPNPDDIPNAGSFFKNPIVDGEVYGNLKQRYPDLVAFPQPSDTYKLAAGWLIDRAGWRGKVVDDVSMHDKQALVLTNPKRVSGKRLLEFVDCVQKDIFQRYGICLDIEPRIFSQKSL